MFLYQSYWIDNHLKLVADDKIPYISDFFTTCDEMVFLPGEEITSADLQDADIVLVRTVTPVDEKLLANTAVKFVGTTTTGTDHIDENWLVKKNIYFASSAGANSQAVTEYVAYCIDALKKQNYLCEKNLTAGIIGYGRIGNLVSALLKKLNFNVVIYDPLLPPEKNFVSLEKLIECSDLISIHTPLTKTGLYPTFHMINDTLLKKIKSNTILLNTARGSVIDQVALLNTKNMILCLDVWENEPLISLELLHKVTIGTPHIAGYSVQAKYRATEMIFEHAADFFKWEKCTRSFFKTKTSSIYNPIQHTQEFRHAFSHCKTSDDIKKVFINARKQYPLR